jgi:hypothetical protein
LPQLSISGHVKKDGETGSSSQKSSQFFRTHQVEGGARVAGDQKPGPWVEIWDQCDRCGGSGIEPQEHVGLREACRAGCTGGLLRKLVTVKEFHELLHASKEH